jgi:2,4-dienoyl-CoA reductase-like NADH-dependent reductase (Old Yellow Enzyme family)/thioredoxin reductase
MRHVMAAVLFSDLTSKQSKGHDGGSVMTTFNKYPNIFSPLKVGTSEYRSRFEFAPMVCDMTNSIGEPMQSYIEFVELQASTGVGTIHIGATPVNTTNAVDFPAELDITDDSKSRGLEMIAEAAHRFSSKISIELVHAGRGADPALISTPYALAPSNFPIPGRSAFIKEMNNQEIDEVVADFVSCALRLQRASFDGVLVHGAHGNLIAQFLSPYTNTRNDWWGGTAEKRKRFPLKLLQAMREAVGPDFILEMRISGDEIVEGGMRVPDVIDFLKDAQEYIDIVNVSAGLIVEKRGEVYSMPTYFRPRLANLPYAEQIKSDPDIHIPIMLAGGVTAHEFERVEQLIADGKIDGVSVARSLLADPDALNNAYRGKEDRTTPCLRCWLCAGGIHPSILCAVNPRLGRTFRYSRYWKTEEPKKVVVVGGGVAGTEAARTLALRGHQVVLFEASDRLGGHLKSISQLPFKDDMLFYTDWLNSETLRLVKDIRFNTNATTELVMAEEPDVVIIATGSVPAKPPISGLDLDNVIGVLDADAGRVKIPSGSKVVVCGGGLSGAESGLSLAMAGCEVKVVDQLPIDGFASGSHGIARNALMVQLEDYQVELIPDSLVRSIEDNTVKIEGRDWKYRNLEADYIINAFGMKSNKSLADELREVLPDVYIVGDAYAVGNIMNANHTAFNCVMNI